MTLAVVEKFSCEARVPTSKWNLQVGCGADIVVFDAENIRDVADYGNGAQPSVGVCELLVGDRCVLSGGELKENILPGRGVSGRYHA